MKDLWKGLQYKHQQWAFAVRALSAAGWKWNRKNCWERDGYEINDEALMDFIIAYPWAVEWLLESIENGSNGWSVAVKREKTCCSVTIKKL